MDFQEKQAIAYLQEKPLLHMDMLEAIRRGHAKLLEASGRGIVLLDRPSGACMISAVDEKAAIRMLSRVKNADVFVTHQDSSTAAVRKKISCRRKTECYQSVYQKKEPMEAPLGAVEIRRLDESFLPFVSTHYSRAENESYLRERLKSGTMYGAFWERIPVGFIGMHAEGSVGMLEVLPEYRRRGIAGVLVTYLANRILKRGWVPFGQIIVGNTASVHLNRKLGFTISQETVCWLS